MRGISLILTVLSTFTGAAFAAMTYESNEESPGTPAVAVCDGDVYIAWARPDLTLKFGLFELKGSGDLWLDESESLSDRTANALGLSISDDKLLMAWADSDGDVDLVYYKIKSAGDFKFVDKKGVGKKSSGGASVAIGGTRGYIGYVDQKDSRVTVAVYDLGKSRPKRKNIIELPECETNYPCSIGVVDNVLVVAWVNEKGKLSLTTYEIKGSVKDTKLTYVKEYPTEDRLAAQPALAVIGDEVLAAYVDRDDQYIHMRYYTVESDMSLSEGTELRISERPSTSVALALDAKESIYAVYIDEDGEIALHKR
ncbi:MAG: hypothetical protein JSW52_08170 [Candidatus Coatesbacteria bacterium]|nr:MAG: hypothetical protein JSW52_08170 [Candidatus Coatesbacteria bacterium]